MNILIINDINDYNKIIKQHFSLTKGFYFANGLASFSSNKVYFLTTGKSIFSNNIYFTNINEINQEFISHINLIVLIRENNIIDILDKLPIIKNWIFDDKRLELNKKLAIKSDSLSWIYSKSYLSIFEKKYDISFPDFVDKYFDILFVQTEQYKLFSIDIIKKRLDNDNICYSQRFLNKIFISRMGVPNKLPFDFKIENPYLNHNYCLDNFMKMKPDTALHPLIYTLKNRVYTNKKLEDYEKKKTILIYMGRIKVDGGRILYLMRDIMKELGNDYELHIFPGRFELPDIDIQVFSPKYYDNLQTLRDYIFPNSDNVIIHTSFDETTKTKWVQYADIGIDFCSARPENKISNAGHAKVLEYCYYGLKVVCEKNICNSHLVYNSNNGILLNGIANMKDYVNAIKIIKEIPPNKKQISKNTIDDSNWNLIAKEFMDFLNKV